MLHLDNADVGCCFAVAAAPQAEPIDERTALAELLSDLDHVPTPEEAKRMLLSSEPRKKIPVTTYGANKVRCLCQPLCSEMQEHLKSGSVMGLNNVSICFLLTMKSFPIRIVHSKCAQAVVKQAMAPKILEVVKQPMWLAPTSFSFLTGSSVEAGSESKTAAMMANIVPSVFRLLASV